MTSVKARAVRFDRYGGRDVLYVADIDMPSPGPGEVLVEVLAAGINPGEAGIRLGAMHEIFPATFPSGEGSDLAGVVLVVGPEVTEFTVGDEIMGFSLRRSSHATHTVVPVGQLIPKPAQLSWEVAGSLYVVGCTAYAAARAVAPPAPPSPASASRSWVVVRLRTWVRFIHPGWPLLISRVPLHRVISAEWSRPTRPVAVPCTRSCTGGRAPGTAARRATTWSITAAR